MMDTQSYNSSPNTEERNSEEATMPSSDSYSSYERGGKDSVSTILERIKRQHIFIGLLVILIGWGGYKIIHKIIEVSSVPTRTLQKKGVKPVPTLWQAANDRITYLERARQSTQLRLDKLSSEISKLNSSLSSVDNQLTQLNEQTQVLQFQQESLLTKQYQEKTKIKKERPTTNLIYFVRAIIPGRVWLTSQKDGSTLTLGVGDSLPGYGSITAISPEQGTITLSSGSIIGYNPDDR